MTGQGFVKNMYSINRQNRKVIFLRVTFRLSENHPIFLGNVIRLSIIMKTRGFYV